MKVGVIGAGSWGTALAKVAADAGHEVIIWAYESEVVASLEARSLNDLYLSGIVLPKIEATADLARAVGGRDLLISVMPSHVVRHVWEEAGPHIDGNPTIISATKGIEEVTLASMVEVLRETTPRRLHANLGALSGPSFAREVAQGQPTAVVVAAKNLQSARAVQRALRTPYFRVYTSTDLVGVEVGGAVKNVMAIAAGMADGLGFGNNARAAVITRGLAEITRLAVAKGANPMTLAGLSGMGDLVLTCTGHLSRNHKAGVKLGQGQTLAEIQSGTLMVAEGIRNAISCRALALRVGVEMPVVEMVYSVLYEGLSPREGARTLMAREQKHELEGYDS
ncbi:MAG: NAD(P)-dependent glycerol-3-phosphate dehydrogenase [Deltaproteobacteria bacterium]|nr:NAD(P)-dependent glycerol-3-phosphate dehydrogenase [Deltaproteobacteria bacterium]